MDTLAGALNQKLRVLKVTPGGTPMLSPAAAVRFACVLAIFSGGNDVLAQNPAPVPVVTVCDVLMNPAQYKGKDIILMGRFSHTDEGSWLTEDRCERPIETEGYEWAPFVWLSCCYEPAPTRPEGFPAMANLALSSKLEVLRKRTELKTHQEFQSVSEWRLRDGKWVQTSTWSGWRTVPDRWGVVYGRLENRERLRPPKGSGPDGVPGNGFGRLAGAPAQLVHKAGVLQLVSDPPPSSR